MPTTVTLSLNAAQIVQARIDCGEFPDALSVIEAALKDTERDDEVEQWIKDVVVPTYDALKVTRMKTYSSEEVKAQLASLIWASKAKTIAA